MMKRLDEAEKEIEISRKMDPEGKTMAIPQALLYAARGEKDKALELISGKNTMNIGATCIYIFLGLHEEAIRTIEKGIEHGFAEQGYYLYPYPTLAANPVFESIRKEPRFQEILKQQKAIYEERLGKFAKF